MNNVVPSSAIIQLSHVHEVDSTFSNSVDKTWKHLSNEVSKEGSLWIIGSNYYRNNQLVPWPLMMAERIETTTPFKLKNIFIWYKEMNPIEVKKLVPAHLYILFFVRSVEDYLFNKDSIREPHIFKGIEWGGKRTKGKSAYHKREVKRYGSKGRDPGNVFYETKRDDNGYVLEVLEYEPRDIYKKIILVCSKEKWRIITNIEDELISDVAESLNRKFVPLEVGF